MFKYLLVVGFACIAYACNAGPLNKDEDRFAKNLFSVIECPQVQPMFGSFAVCAKSYSVPDNDSGVIVLNMKWSPRREIVLPFEKWEEEGKSKLFLEKVVCDAVARGLGVTEEAILENHAGIIQTIHLANQDAASLDWIRKNFASRTRIVLELASESKNYLITNWAYTEANTVPHRCTVEEISKLN